jgi:hypothetical protein
MSESEDLYTVFEAGRQTGFFEGGVRLAVILWLGEWGRRAHLRRSLRHRQAKLECEWGASGCHRRARHMVTTRATRDPAGVATYPMCDWCVTIHDPSLGGTGGYSEHDFVKREPIDP